MWKLILLAALAGSSRASDVLEFTDDDFDSRIGDHDLILVEFFAPWCGHCKRLAPEYEAAATRLKGTVALAKVDCTANSNVCSKYGVSEESGPMMGPRSMGIVSFLKKQAGPASVELKTEADFDKFVADRMQVAGRVPEAASALRDNYRFAHTNSEALLQQHGIDGEGIVLFRPPRLNSKFEDGSVKFTEDKFTSNKIKKFIQDNIFGICPHMTDDNKDQLKGKDLLVAYYDVDYDKNPKGSNYWRNRVMKVAKSVLDQGKKLNFFGMSGSSGELPLVAIRSAKGDKFVMSEEFSVSSERFLQDYFNGSLLILRKLWQADALNLPACLQVVVAENFDSIVNDDSKDVLIEFYAPWCGHCKSLEPKYKELGEKLADDPNVVIAKMDATANDVPSPYEVSGSFPTIYFSTAGRKMNPKRYEVARVADFVSYLKREASNPLVMQEEPKKKKKKDKVDL
uniref:Protein disulfide-isomerase A3 n=1 Tax=Salarias fasciatus TaxID=181472 RepID=A0A672FQF0_SALFA